MTDRSVARAVDALKRGWPVRVDGWTLLAIETADDAGLAALDGHSPADVLLAGHRAATLKLTNQRDALPTAPVRVAREPWLDLSAAVALADPARDLRTPLKGPYRSVPLDAPRAAAAALRLARLAGLLPALFVGDGRAEAEASVNAVLAHDEAATLRLSSRARLPLDLPVRTEIVAFRSAADAAEHVALLVGEPTGRPPLARLHSECLTGDVFGSLKCDCGPQLDEALRLIAADGWGVLLYLRQEGRGIGLVNKLRAYQLQDQGFDTVDANLRLGFADDERSFATAGAMLRLLGMREVRLLTNNPAKVAGLAAGGVEVVERVPHALPANPHNEGYLATKRTRSGHRL